jgi:hypothetical protein
MRITPKSILEVCALVADSHGNAGEAIAAAIRAIDLNDLFEPIDDQHRKYVYRKTVKGHEYVYFRMPNGRVIRLPNDETSVEFRKQYARCLGTANQMKAVRKRLRSGS